MNPNSIIGNHIFIIEDDMVMQYLMKRIFSGICDITVFSDGLSAWEALQKGRVPDAIITDLNTPFINGRQLLSKVKSDAALCHVPLIIVSADTSTDIQFNCLLAGAYDYLTKPFEPKELISRVGEAISAVSHPSLMHA